jgi:hypothetical protein
MKQLEPFQVWTETGIKTAKYLSGQIIGDNMDTQSAFYWQLFDEIIDEEGNAKPNLPIREGNLDMTPEEYEAWDNSNEEGYAFIAKKINVTIVES